MTRVNKRKISINEIDKNKALSFFVCVIFLFLAISDLFGNPFLRYTDEALEVFLIFILIFNYSKSRISVITFLLLFNLFGLVGNLLSGYSISPIYILEDVLLCSKYIVCLLGFQALIEKQSTKNIKNILKGLNIISTLLILLMFPVCAIQRLQGVARTNFFASYSGIVGLYSAIFCYIHYLNYKFSIINQKRLLIFLLILDFATCILSDSSISLIALAFFVVTLLWKQIQKHRVVSFVVILCGIVAFGIAFSSKISGYFINSGAPRHIFYQYSFYVAKKYFPVGSGFGLYGGTIAAQNYSPLYMDLGFNKIWVVGIDSNFLSDTFFPSVIGQAGFIGTLFYISCLILIGVRFYKQIDKNNISVIPILLLIFITISGFTSNFINSTIGPVFGLISIISLNLNKKSKKRISTSRRTGYVLSVASHSMA